MKKYNNPVPTTDIIIEKDNKIVLIKRGREPFKGKLALPGGFVEYREKVEDAAIREAEEETNLKVKLITILGVYSDPHRDPRGPLTSTVFIAKPLSNDLKGGDDAADAKWVEPKKIDKDDLASDHFKIIQDYLKHKKSRETYWSSK